MIYEAPPARLTPTPSADLHVHARGLGGARGQRALWTAGTFVAVPLIAAVLCYSHTRLIGPSLVLFVCVAGVAIAIDHQRFPLHLMPIAGLAVRVLAPLLGIAAAWLISLAFEPLPLGGLIEPLLGAWLISAVVMITMARLRRRLRVRLAVVGSPELALSLKQEIGLAKLTGYEVVGWIGPPQTGRPAGPIPYLGQVGGVAEVVRSRALDLIVFGIRESGLDRRPDQGSSSLQVLEAVAAALLSSPTRLIGANQFFEEAFGHAPVRTMNAAWFQYVLHPRFRQSSPVSKRLFDLLIGSALLLISLPVLALCALAIKLEDRGPVLYRQWRVGAAGRALEVLKLRTMSTGAEADGLPRWASIDDDRVTRVGRFLRRAHLDELPQLLNVLAGRMSLVGPRPERPEFIAQLERQLPYFDRRQVMKPGLTGWAQVRIGYVDSDLGTAWKLAHDLYYLKHRSAVLDAMILLETLVTPIRDRRVGSRAGDQLFVGAAARER